MNRLWGGKVWLRSFRFSNFLNTFQRQRALPLGWWHSSTPRVFVVEDEHTEHKPSGMPSGVWECRSTDGLNLAHLNPAQHERACCHSVLGALPTVLSGHTRKNTRIFRQRHWLYSISFHSLSVSVPPWTGVFGSTRRWLLLACGVAACLRKNNIRIFSMKVNIIYQNWETKTPAGMLATIGGGRSLTGERKNFPFRWL